MGSFFSSSCIPSSIDSLTDEEIYALLKQRDKSTAIRAPNDDKLIATSVWRISEDAVAKFTYSPAEAFMMSYVSSHTSIPIPRVRRVLPARPGDPSPRTFWIVMDFVDGETLEHAWPRLSWWRRLYAIYTARRYLRELQKVPLPHKDLPGPFDESGKSYLCRGYYFTEDGAGPFRSYADMAAWFDRRRFDVLAAIHSATGVISPRPKFDASHPLVLCHMDLHMRNFLLDARGALWLIDWAYAGAFPAWMEYAQMAVWADAALSEMRPPKFWTFCVRFMVGDYRRYKVDYLDKLRWAWDRHAEDYFPLDYFSKLDLTVD